MEMLREVGLSLLWSLGITAIAMMYTIGVMTLTTVFIEAISLLVERR